MPRTTCCVPGCCKRRGYGFPPSIELKRAWLQAIQREGWVPKEASTVCKDHFTRQDYVVEDGMVTEKLKKTAVPSNFWWCTSQSTNFQNTSIKKIGISPVKKTVTAKKKLSAMGSAMSVSVRRLDKSALSRLTSCDEDEAGEEEEEEEEEYQDEIEDEEDEDLDEFEDAGATLDDSDEEYKGEDDEDELDEDEDDYNQGDLDDDDEELVVRSKPKPKAKQLNKPLITNTPKNVAKKRKSVDDDAEDNILSGSKRTRVDTLPEYSRQLQKAYKEISRLSARCQVLDASLKNKTYVTHRSRTIYQIGKYVLPHQLSFIEAQAMNSSLPPSQRRWSRRMRNICLGLHRHSRHAYAFMSKIFALPTEAELHKWGAQSNVGSAEGDVAANNVSLVEAEALVDEATFDNLMAVIL